MLTEETKLRMQLLQNRLDEAGVRDIGLTINPEYRRTDKNYDAFVNDVCNLFEKYFDGEIRPITTEELAGL